MVGVVVTVAGVCFVIYGAVWSDLRAILGGLLLATVGLFLAARSTLSCDLTEPG